MKLLHVLPTAALALIVVSVSAQTQAPGLWESSMTMKSGGADMDKAQADMQAQLAAMPPEQRKMAEQMMASRGMSAGGGGHATTVKVCITKEQAAKPAEARMNGDCTQSDVQRTADSIRFKFECTKPVASSGTGTWSFASDKAYTGKIVSVAQVNGKAQPTNIEMTGRWLAADCGDVKPRAATGQ